MKTLLVIGSLLVFNLTFLGCSSSDTAHQKCKIQVVQENKKIETVSVTCSPPVKAMDIYNSTRKEVESLLGPQRSDMPNSEKVGHYNDGGIGVVYSNDTAIYFTLMPENLPMKPEAILEFLGLTGQLSFPLANDPPTVIDWSATDEYPRVVAIPDKKKPNKVQSITVGRFAFAHKWNRDGR